MTQSAHSRTYAQMTGWENFWWVAINIVTLGFPYFRKMTLKRAMLEALNAHQIALDYRQADALSYSRSPREVREAPRELDARD